MKTIKIGAVIPHSNAKHITVKGRNNHQKPKLSRPQEQAITKFVAEQFGAAAKSAFVWDAKNARYTVVLKVEGSEVLEKATAFEATHKAFSDRYFLTEAEDGSSYSVAEWGNLQQPVATVTV